MDNVQGKSWKLRFAVCDDNEIFCDKIFKRLQQIRPEYDIDMFMSGVELLKCKNEYDIIFLDIEMPDMNGIAVGLELRNRKVASHIIYMTFYREFAQDAFRVKAHRFLTKDCSDEKLLEAIETAEDEIFTDVKLCIEENGNIIYTSIRKISCVEAYGDGVFVYLEDRIIDSKKTLSYWMETLGQEYFYQVNRSFLVSYDHINYYKDGKIEVEFKKDLIKVARRKRKEFEKKRLDYMVRRYIRMK